MNSNAISLILVLGLVIGCSLTLFAGAIILIKEASGVSLVKRVFRFGLAGILALPFLVISFFTAWFTVDNFPFTSGIVAHDFAPNGDEICIVQIFRDIEAYQVSLYARRPGQPWVWNYLAHEDDRWRNCHTEFDGDSLRVYTGSTLRKTFALADATKIPENSQYQLPAELTPQQILDRRNR